MAFNLLIKPREGLVTECRSKLRRAPSSSWSRGFQNLHLCPTALRQHRLSRERFFQLTSGLSYLHTFIPTSAANGRPSLQPPNRWMAFVQMFTVRPWEALSEDSRVRSRQKGVR